MFVANYWVLNVIVECISKLVERRDLTSEEATTAMNEIMKGEASEPQTASFLTALRMKGESAEEITAFARVMRENALKIETNATNLLDTCGTGGDKIKTFNVSTATAFVLAGAGINVAKHGNRAVTSKAGSADVLEELGANINMQTREAARVLEKTGITFLFAPIWHPAMKHAAPVRKAIKIRTVFNMLGPLTNPFEAKKQVIGVYEAELVEKIGKVLKELGCERGFVVHGLDGLDEVSTIGKTLMCEVNAKGIRKREVTPEDFGLARAKIEDVLGGDAKENARTIIAIFKGERGAKRDLVVTNAALGLIVGGKANELKEAAQKAEEAIDKGNALAKLKLFVKETGGNTVKIEELEKTIQTTL